MDGQGAFASELILATVGSYAAGTVLRQQEGAGEDESVSFGDLTRDTEVRLRYLAEALGVDRPALFHQHLAWHKVALVAREIPLEFLLSNLGCMREELLERMPRGAGTLPASWIEEAVDFVQVAPETVPTHLPEQGPFAEPTRRYLLALLEGRRLEALAIIDDLTANGAETAEIHQQVLTPIQRELGRMWQLDEIHIAEEHFGSQITEEVLARLRARVQPPKEPGPRLIATTVDGDLHHIGISMVADQFAIAGWDPLRFGASVPPADLVRALQEYEADLLVLSAHLGLQVRASADLIRAIRASEGCRDTPILIGGPPFEAVPDLWEVVGADACARDGAEAVAVASRLVAG